MESQRSLHGHPLTLPWLLVPLLLLATGTGYILFLSSDDRVDSVFQQCINGTDGLPTVPVIGIPLCCLLSFFEAALDSRRSAAIMGEILAYVGCLLTLTTTEAARTRNSHSWIISNPTASWLVFNLAGGALVWQLLIVPSYLHHHLKHKPVLQGEAQPDSAEQPLLGDVEAEPSGARVDMAEIYAIPIAVAVGFGLPCIYMVLRPNGLSIGLWLFFPAYVSLLRQLVRYSMSHITRQHTQQDVLHPESEHFALLWLYAIPVLSSIAAHFALVYDMFAVADDRSDVTRAALRFIQLDFAAIGVTVLYWVCISQGVRMALWSLLIGVFLGPGAGLCASWIQHERKQECSHSPLYDPCHDAKVKKL